jgi:hypothetical protein
LLKSDVSAPPIERVRLNAALFNFSNTWQNKKINYILRKLRALGRMQWTKDLAALAAFRDTLQTIFSQQFNLAYVALTTLSCDDLHEISLRLFGAQPYREIGNAVHNRKTLMTALKNPTTVDRNAIALTRMRLRFAAQPLPSLPSTYLTDAELKCLDTEPSADNLARQSLILIETGTASRNLRVVH